MPTTTWQISIFKITQLRRVFILSFDENRACILSKRYFTLGENDKIERFIKSRENLKKL